MSKYSDKLARRRLMGDENATNIPAYPLMDPNSAEAMPDTTIGKAVENYKRLLEDVRRFRDRIVELKEARHKAESYAGALEGRLKQMHQRARAAERKIVALEARIHVLEEAVPK